MPLDKSIEHGREHRKPWHDSRAFDCSCRNHGGCPACESKRLRWRKRWKQMAKEIANAHD